MGLKVGLTGGLGSGKSTVATILLELGAKVFFADEIARAMMQPGQDVFAAIVDCFGQAVVLENGGLNRGELARLAFDEGRVEELNAIVHPAAIARQELLVSEVFADDPAAIVVVESALIFETMHGQGWRERFDRLILVRSEDEAKVARFVARSGGGDSPGLQAEARRRLARMIPDEEKAGLVDYVIENDGSLEELRAAVRLLWAQLQRCG